ncbi:MAG: hypothetical protein AAF202_11080, partial [Pseudomonadota bacterium]
SSPFMSRSISKAPIRMGYYVGNGKILTSSRHFRGLEGLLIKNFDGKKYEVKKDQYELFQDASQGFALQFRDQLFPSLAGLGLTPRSQFAILDVKNPEILEMDNLPVADLSLESPLSSEVWAVGAFLNEEASKQRLEQEQGMILKPEQESESRALPIGFLDFDATRIGPDVFQITPRVTDSEIAKLGLLNGAPIFTQSPSQRAIGSASLHAMYSGDIEDRFPRPVVATKSLSLQALVKVGSSAWRVSALESLLSQGSEVMPQEYWERMVHEFAGASHSHSSLLHVQQDMASQFEPLLSYKDGKAMGMKLFVAARNHRETGRPGWPAAERDTSQQAFLAVFRGALEQARGQLAEMTCASEMGARWSWPGDLQ